MNTMEYKVGLVVEHLKLPSYGRGKIISVRELSIEILFSTGQVKKYSTDNLMVRISEDQSDPCPVVRPVLKSRSSVKKSTVPRQRNLPISQQRNGGVDGKMSREIIGNLKWKKWLLVILVELLERRPEVYPELSYQKLCQEKTFADFVKSAFGKKWCNEFKNKPDFVQQQILRSKVPESDYQRIQNKLLCLEKILLEAKKIFLIKEEKRINIAYAKRNKKKKYKPRWIVTGGTRGYFSRNYNRHR